MKFRFLFSFSALCLVLFSACNSLPKHASLIPKDAMMVAGINTSELSKKIAWSAITGSDLFKEMQERIPNKEAASGLEDAGIDVMNTSYVYVLPGSIQDGNTVVGLVPLSVAAKWEAYLKKTFPQQAFKTSNGRQETMLADGLYAAWNKDLLVLLTSNKPAPDYSRYLDEEGNVADEAIAQEDNWLMHNPQKVSAAINKAFTIPKDNSITSDKRFSALEKQSHDITLWVNYEALMTQSMGALNGMAGGMNFGSALWKGAAVASGFDFEKGKIAGDFKYYVADALKDASEEMTNGDADKNMISKLPGENLDVVAAMHFSPKGVKMMLEKAGLLGFLNLGLAQSNITTDDLFEAFSGNVAFTLNDFSMRYNNKYMADADTIMESNNNGDETNMNILYVMGIGKKEKFDKILSVGIAVGLLQPSGTNAFIFGNAAEGYVLLRDDKFAVLSNKEMNAQSFLQGKYKKEKMPENVKDKISGHPFGMFFDVEKIMNAVEIDDEDRGNQAMLAEVKKLLKNISSSGGDFKRDAFIYDLNVNFKNDKENALILLLDFATRMKDASDLRQPDMPVADTTQAALVF